MPSRLINKFNELLHKGDNAHALDKIEKKIEVDKWWEEMSKPGENGKYKLMDKCKEFNIANYGELAPLVGYKDSSIVSHSMKNDKSCETAREAIYDFFQDELNIQPPKVMVEKEPGKKVSKNESLVYDRKYTKYRGYVTCDTLSKEELNHIIDWYESSDIRNWARTYNKDAIIIANDINVSRHTAKMLLERNIVWLQILIKFYNYVNKTNDVLNTQKEELPINVLEYNTIDSNNTTKINTNNNEMGEDKLKDKILNIYVGKIESIDKQANDIKNAINDLENTLKQLGKEKAIYNQIIEDVNEFSKEN